MKTLLWILLAALAVAISAGFYMGAFLHIDIAERQGGPFTFIYRETASDEMNKIGEITTALDASLESRGIAHRKPLDVFMPDGRAEIGFAIEGASPDQLAALPDRGKMREIPAQRYMVAEFPWRNPASFMLGYLKVDPALSKYREQHGYKKVEALALNDSGVIVYMQPVVPE